MCLFMIMATKYLKLFTTNSSTQTRILSSTRTLIIMPRNICRKPSETKIEMDEASRPLTDDFLHGLNVC